ncbi:MAG: aminoacyl-tRNA hydrolase [Bacteroidetes bacterium CG18_big_fil_WC_8_21_14_2_50_41_14]|nr:MAG: aminoacyl-tRNA hydrolase [Bacteroidetes bacterium CG18_big_fil_WC_8_21_14_2_50_41_14]PIY30507.1 MAG: aminoacyl-tRNA hydrolase [Bacteroidetes bacterium CG_4_10_14_3_um_filter_42_6]
MIDALTPENPKNSPRRDFSPEWTFSASRSSGPGGQNVNKVSSKMELRFHIMDSSLLSESEKEMLTEKLANKINNEGFLVLTCQTSRSQLANKEEVIEKFYALIAKALKPRKKRVPTKPGKGSIERKLKEKKRIAEKKQLRKRPDEE